MSYWEDANKKRGAKPGAGGYFTQQPLAPLQQPIAPLSKPPPAYASRSTPVSAPSFDYQASGYTPWGPTSSPTLGHSGGYSAAPAPAAKPPGVLTKPLQEETWFSENKDRLAKPGAGEGVMNEGANMLRQPNRMAGFADQQAGYFSDPSAQEGYASRQLPGMEGQKSYQEQLYESGNKGLNLHYDREYQKRQKRLGDQMAGMGVFGSGATARGMFELEAEMGSQQARDMAGLAGQADAGRMGRLGEARATAAGSDAGATDRIKLGADVNNLATNSVINQGKGLADIGGGLADAALGRDSLAQAGASGAQKATERRERYPIQDATNLAEAQAGLFTGGTDKISSEQLGIATEGINALLAQGTISDQDAQALQAMLGQAGGNAIRIIELIKKGTPPAQAMASGGAAGPAPSADGYG